MIDITPQLRRLVEGLYIRTSEQKIDWKFEEQENVCEAALGDGYVQVVQEADEDGDYYSYVRILNKSRDVMDNIYGGSLGGKNIIPANTNHSHYWELMRDLYSSARRSALGADKIVDSIVGVLGVANLALDDVPF